MKASRITKLIGVILLCLIPLQNLHAACSFCKDDSDPAADELQQEIDEADPDN
ncbi:MAG TPA: hypothetical protein VLG38_02655 [Gammaproteobacteria bacterium]|nr:hypothetical protein [Gammaproteobacteria bacterium]